MAESNKPLVVVLGFHQTFERLPVKGDPLNDEIDAHGFKLDAKGKRVLENTQVDWATYAPLHSPTGSSTSERIRHLKPTEEILDGENGEKTKFMLARWAAIEPAYEAWLKGHELPTNGTPLAIWPGVSTAMADELKKYNIRTVEEVRDLMEAQLDRIKLPNMRALKSQAAAFLENMKGNEAAEREAERDEEIANLKAALDEQREQLAAAMQLLEEQANGGGTTEVAALKAKLDAKGIKYHHKAGIATLKALLEDEAA
ncbi:hypothetical protein [Rhizobium rhizogenes]|uniref:hypothetical protein n=1 Tax=Rhizobium rhizogenes TaxID=359 RepID=UPI0022C56027|nr:hypothetical protein [Rhizobium rhizogenes]MCZ7488538.1 hypothetical protein [Rhizobium rhizogenes]